MKVDDSYHKSMYVLFIFQIVLRECTNLLTIIHHFPNKVCKSEAAVLKMCLKIALFPFLYLSKSPLHHLYFGQTLTLLCVQIPRLC